jgi:hypothetical protein
MKIRMQVMLLSFLLAVSLGAAQGHCMLYNGSLSTGVNGGLVPDGNWQPSTFSWAVSTVDGSPGLWKYVYDLQLPGSAHKINQLIVEAPLVSSITTTWTANIGTHQTQTGLVDLKGLKFTGAGSPSTTH